VTQPTLNRRHFVAASFAAIIAGPKAIAAVLEEQQRREREALIVAQLRIQGLAAIQSMWRRVQKDLLAGFQLEPAEWDAFDVSAPSGFRAWSQRHPS
jgi:hypothetical protein